MCWIAHYKISSYFKELKNRLNPIRIFILNSAITIIFLLYLLSLSCFISHPLEKTGFEAEYVLITIGSTIATIFVLAFSLSIITVQKASDSWTPTITKLYSQDVPTKIIGFIFSLFTTSTFVLPIINVGNDEKILAYVGIFFLAVTLDVTRWYYSYICNLLNPITAIKSLTNSCKSDIGKYNSLVKKHAYCACNMLPYAEHKKTNVDELNLYYFSTSSILKQINQTISEIVDFTNKSIERNDIIVTSGSLNSILEITEYVVDIRKDNLGVIQGLNFTHASSLDNFLNHVYESLGNIFNVAMSNRNEKCAVEILQYMQK